MAGADWLPAPELAGLLFDEMVGVDDASDVLAWLELDFVADAERVAEALKVADADMVPFRADAPRSADPDVLESVEKMVEFDGALGPGRDHEELEAVDAVPVMVPD